jgi:hypothetical protein
VLAVMVSSLRWVGLKAILSPAEVSHAAKAKGKEVLLH